LIRVKEKFLAHASDEAETDRGFHDRNSNGLNVQITGYTEYRQADHNNRTAVRAKFGASQHKDAGSHATEPMMDSKP
jgi:hypothetical protein